MTMDAISYMRTDLRDISAILAARMLGLSDSLIATGLDGYPDGRLVIFPDATQARCGSQIVAVKVVGSLKRRSEFYHVQEVYIPISPCILHLTDLRRNSRIPCNDFMVSSMRMFAPGLELI